MVDPQNNSTFAELYCLDEKKYAENSVKALPFSFRTNKRLHEAGIITIADLLQKTPAEMMRIEGFGIGCLKEIGHVLTNLDQHLSVEAAQQPLVPAVVTAQGGKPSITVSEQPLGDRFGIDPDDYLKTDVLSLSFSKRVSNLLMQNHITTIGLLLEKTMEQLWGMRGFGRTCEEEIETKLLALRATTANCKNTFAKRFSAEERLLMANGDFSFIDASALCNEEAEFVFRCIEAQKTLGKELAYACINTPKKIIPIFEMFNDFSRINAWQEEIRSILDELPDYRKNNQAITYISAFTHDEEDRIALLKLYPTGTSPLKAIADYDNFDESSVYRAKQFLNWCKYDLRAEIAQLFSVLYPNERNQKIVQLRAQKYTLEQIGKNYGLTRERVRQLESKIQRVFNARQGRIKIISKINADKNGTSVVTPANIAEYCSDHLQELLFLLRNCVSTNFSYDKDLDVFIIGDDSTHERIFAFIEKLPDIIPAKDIARFYQEAKEEYYLPEEMVDKAILETYRLTGDVYHRTTLSLAKIYTEIIREFYPDGIDAYNPETIAQFRQRVFEKYGAVKLPENDHALTSRIAGICILCGRGRYRLKQKQYIPKDLAQRICDYIEDSDMDIFMTNILFAVFEEELRKHGVDNKYYLQGILHELYGERFTFTRDYISKDPSITSIYPSIVNFIRSSDYPVSKMQILAKYPGLPEIAISIATSDPEVLTYYGGNFFHVDSLKISDDEKNYLDSVMRQVVADGNIHHTKEVYAAANAEKPEIFARNGAFYPFSAGSILEYLFQNRYEFARPFIAKKGIDITDSADRLQGFVNKHETVTVAQITEFIRSTKINVPSLLDLIDACNDRFLLTDSNTLQLIESTGVDCETTQEIEDMILLEITETVRIRDLLCWGQLPAVKVPWTDWLVYSVLRKWGNKVEVAPSNPQFKYAVPLVAPAGKMDTTQYIETFKVDSQTGQGAPVAIHDLDRIDDILVDILSEDLLEEDLWDSEI